jgi:hypothetical protein
MTVTDAKRKAILPLVLVASLLPVSCSGGESSRVGTTSAPTDSPDTSGASISSTAQDGVGTTHVRKLPWLGEVVISRTSEHGIVIRDKATHGSRFALSGEAAGECLSFLEANPEPSRQALESACPGNAR